MKVISSCLKQLTQKGLINIPLEVPNELLNEDWAITNHGQTLARLDERGGMDITEIWLNILSMNLDFMDKGTTQRRIDVLNILIKNFKDNG